MRLNIRNANQRWYFYRVVQMILLAAAGWFAATYIGETRQDKRDLALLEAVKRKDTQSVVRLLKDGADPNAQRRHVYWVEMHGPRGIPTPQESFWTRMAKLLHIYSTKRRAEWVDDAPLNVTSLSWDTAAARILLQHGARVDIKDEDGNTPLNRALRAAVAIAHTQGDKPALHAARRSYVALLLARGADQNATSCNNMATPLSLAQRLPDRETVRMLLCSGGTGKTPSVPCW